VPGEEADIDQAAAAAECAFIFEEDEGGGSSDETFLPALPPPGSFVARGPDEKLLPHVLMSPLALLQDEVYTVYLRLKGK